MKEDWDGTVWELPDTNRCVYCEILLDQPYRVCIDCTAKEGE